MKQVLNQGQSIYAINRISLKCFGKITLPIFPSSVEQVLVFQCKIIMMNVLVYQLRLHP